ncbi:membrane protein [Pseudoclavibacter endophyticus]|uniref:Stage II sporulation protein M n=1 Tax=Pseudoclavibacter endophyticus TaxID=1778590 RepID=A0A6H9WS41_9MICO|nr:stage II sporulation protein M [Pseudoclavibacter endophyticus]KAB1649134.1 stage II sporulation protein M [Pseudoclavibacter endophyticus]GGA65139.1 membrane protein [Pseudoclavibacter endophyticus]
MDLDAFTTAKRGEWDRLRDLARRGGLSGAEADELIARYQSGATDLSALRTMYGETPEADYLSVGLSRARLRFTGAAANIVDVLVRYFTLQLPAALYRVRWWTLAAAVFTILAGMLTAVWVLSNPTVLAYLGSESQLDQYVNEDFVNYYSEYSETAFAARVFTNNAWIAAQCIAFGITGLWVPYVLLQNAIGLGQSAAIFTSYDQLDVFFLWIAPHGLLELTMVFVAAGAGFKLFWTWVVPGARTRGRAIAEEGRRLFVVAIGTTIFLFISGVIEGFVTRQDWPWAIKIGIGALALGLYLVYALWLGGRAAKAGETGDLVRFEAGATTVTAD